MKFFHYRMRLTILCYDHEFTTQQKCQRRTASANIIIAPIDNSKHEETVVKR